LQARPSGSAGPPCLSGYPPQAVYPGFPEKAGYAHQAPARAGDLARRLMGVVGAGSGRLGSGSGWRVSTPGDGALQL